MTEDFRLQMRQWRNKSLNSIFLELLLKYLRSVCSKTKHLFGNLSKELLISDFISSNSVAVSLHLPVPEYFWNTSNGVYLQLRSVSFCFDHNSAPKWNVPNHHITVRMTGNHTLRFPELPMSTMPLKHERKQVNRKKDGEKDIKIKGKLPVFGEERGPR